MDHQNCKKKKTFEKVLLESQTQPTPKIKILHSWEQSGG